MRSSLNREAEGFTKDDDETEKTAATLGTPSSLKSKLDGYLGSV